MPYTILQNELKLESLNETIDSIGHKKAKERFKQLFNLLDKKIKSFDAKLSELKHDLVSDDFIDFYAILENVRFSLGGVDSIFKRRGESVLAFVTNVLDNYKIRYNILEIKKPIKACIVAPEKQINIESTLPELALSTQQNQLHKPHVEHSFHKALTSIAEKCISNSCLAMPIGLSFVTEKEWVLPFLEQLDKDIKMAGICCEQMDRILGAERYTNPFSFIKSQYLFVFCTDQASLTKSDSLLSSIKNAQNNKIFRIGLSGKDYIEKVTDCWHLSSSTYLRNFNKLLCLIYRVEEDYFNEIWNQFFNEIGDDFKNLITHPLDEKCIQQALLEKQAKEKAERAASDEAARAILGLPPLRLEKEEKSSPPLSILGMFHGKKVGENKEEKAAEVLVQPPGGPSFLLASKS